MEDGIAVDDEGSLLLFSTARQAREYASSSDLALNDDDPVLYDLDELIVWLAKPDREVDCVGTLNFWNLFSDLAASVSLESAFRTLDRAKPSIYEKIFAGNNLPAMTPPGQRYVPTWSEEEIRHIVAVMTAGLDLMERALAGHAT